jgi:hypothetical protein
MGVPRNLVCRPAHHGSRDLRLLLSFARHRGRTQEIQNLIRIRELPRIPFSARTASQMKMRLPKYITKTKNTEVIPSPSFSSLPSVISGPVLVVPLRPLLAPVKIQSECGLASPCSSLSARGFLFRVFRVAHTHAGSSRVVPSFRGLPLPWVLVVPSLLSLRPPVKSPLVAALCVRSPA